MIERIRRDGRCDVSSASGRGDVSCNDPRCRGVVLLGLSAPEDELVASFAVAARSPIIKGFAVGRTIFADAAEQWLAGRIDDEAAIADLVRRFGSLVDAWRAARAHQQPLRGTA